MATIDWYVVKDGRSSGPFSGPQMKELAESGRLGKHDLVRRGRDGKEVQASQVKGLFVEPTGKERPTPPPPPRPSGSGPHPASSDRSASRPGVAQAPVWEQPVLIAASVLFCFPLGLVLVWRHPSWDRLRKWGWTGGVGAVFVTLMVVGIMKSGAEQRALAEADAKWDAGDKAGAVVIYRARLGSNARYLKDADKARVYARVIDFDVECGSTESAKLLIAEAVGQNITPQVGHPEAQALLGAEIARRRTPEGQKGSAPTEDRNKYIAEVEASTAVPVPTFSDDEYKYDYGKDDYTSIPAGAKQETRQRVIKGGAEGLAGKPETMEGYVDGSGRFVEHGTYITWTDETKTKKLREGKMLHGKQHGLTTFFYPSGRKKWEMYFVHDKKHGIARSWYENGQQENENPSSDGLTHGRFRQWYESGEPKADETWARGKEHGLHKKWWKSGVLAFVGCFREGKRYGKLYSWNEDGSQGEYGEWEGDRPKGRCRLAFLGGDQRYYFIEADDGDWRGGTTAEFIARMYYFSLRDRPELKLQFDPKMRIANYISPNSGEFFARFGNPTTDGADFEKAPTGAPGHVRDRWRVWSYRCRDGVLRLRVQPTQVGNIMVTSHWRDNP